MKWKSGFILLVCLMFLLVTACSKSGGADGDDKNGKKNEITVWTYPVYDKYEDELKQLIADYEKEQTNIKIKYEVLSWEEGSKKFDVALNAGTPPDIYFHAVNGQIVNSGLALELDKYMTQEMKDDFYPGVLDLGKVQGKQYGIPLYTEVWTFGGNKRIFEEEGIDYKKIQKEGWTWDEFMEIGKKLTKKLPNGSTQYGFVTDGTSNDFLEMISRNAGLLDVVDKDGKFIWNDDRILKTLQFTAELIKEGVMPKETVSLNPQKRTDMFYQSKAAMLSKAFSYYDVLLRQRNKDIDEGKSKGEKIEFILLPVPHEKNSEPKTTVVADGYVAFKQKNDKGEEHAKNTFDVLEYLTGSKAGNSANQLAGNFVRKSQAKAFEGKGIGNPDNQNVAAELFKQAVHPADLFVDASVGEKIKQFKDQVQKPSYQAVLNGEKTPEQAFEDFKTKGKQIFRK